MLPSVSWQDAGITPTNFDGVKRARVEFPSSYQSVLAVAFPNTTDGSTGIGRYASLRAVDIYVSWVFRLIPWSKDYKWNDELVIDSLVFIKRGYPKVHARKDDANRVFGLALPQLHYLAHQDALKDTEYDAEEFFNDYMFAGVLTNPTYPTGTTGEVYTERAVVISSDGDVPVLNIWGDKARGGLFMWLVAKEAPVTAETTYVVDQAGMFATNMGQQGRDVKGRPTRRTTVPRYFPVLSETRESPAMEDLAYIKDGVKLYGHALYIGRIIRNRFYSGAADWAAAPMTNDSPVTNTVRQWRCKRLEAYVEGAL